MTLKNEQPSKEILEAKGIVAYMARNGVAANLLMMFLLIAGLISYQTIVQEIFAETSLEAVQVSVIYPGATPSEVEESIVQKVEEAVKAVEGVKDITGTASEGVGSIAIEMELGTDMARALDDVKGEVDQIQTFPADAEEPNIRELTARQSVMRIAIFGDVSERVLKETAYQLEDGLSALDAVSYVETSSIRDYEISIEVPQSSLQALGLSLNNVSRTVASSSLDSPAGTITAQNEDIRVRTLGQKYNQQNFEDIVLVSTADGALVRLGQIANVKDSFEEADLITAFNGKPVAFVEVSRTSDERVLDITEAVRGHLEEQFEPGLPQGLNYTIWSDDSQFLKGRLNLLLKNAAIGLTLVLIALTLFLDIRLALWTAVGISTAFIGAILLIDLAGSSINMFSLFGFILALGLVVDDAIVVGENIHAQRGKGRTGMGAAIDGTQRVKVPVVFAVLTTIAAFSPLFAISGAIGNILADIPLVVISVLVLSLVECLLILPYHLSHLPPPGTKTNNPITGFFDRVQKKVDAGLQKFINGPLDRVLHYCLKAPFVILSGAVALMILFASFVPAGIIKVGFFPSIESDVVTASLEMPTGTTSERTAEIVKIIENTGREILEEFDAPDEVRGMYSAVGESPPDQGPNFNGGNSASNIGFVQISLEAGLDRSIEVNALENKWRDAVGPVPEAESLVFSADLFSVGAPVSVELSDPDFGIVEQASDRLMQELAEFNGVFDIETDQDAGLQEIQLRLKPEARSLGVTLQDVALQVRAAFFGDEALRVQRGREDVRVYVRLPEDERNSIADVERFRVRVPGGEVALSAIAEVEFGEAPSIIRRTDGRRVTTVTADLNTDVVTGQEIAERIANDIMPRLQADYPQLQYSFGGEQEEQEESFGDLGVAFLIALMMIYVLLAIPFKSYVQPFIIMAVIPFGVIGAMIGHILLDIQLVVLSIFGIIALSGVIVNGSLVMIDFVNENLRNGMEIKDAVITAAKSRFRPIMLTSFTTFLGVAPITFETSLQAQFLIPMAASLGFGVLFGTVILQLLIPTLAYLEYKARMKLRRLLKRNKSEDPATIQV